MLARKRHKLLETAAVGGVSSPPAGMLSKAFLYKNQLHHPRLRSDSRINIKAVMLRSAGDESWLGFFRQADKWNDCYIFPQ
jgi:hypothetical protein